MAENSAQRELLEGVCEVFGMEAPPKRIEVYDNSHIQGTNALGGMIVAGPDGFEKGEYRKFNIKSTELTPGDDYGMMREVLTRRFSRLVKESGEDEAKAKWPDLALIDGGPGQLSVARAVLEDLGVEDVLLVGISKGPDRDAGREHFYMTGREPVRLDPKIPVLYYLQRHRDEAHRLAIGSHRKKRSKAIGANPLDEIAGVGASRKRALLQHFGSAKAVSAASLADLESVGGVSKTLAKKVYDFFHPTG
jgi:excinuclease ABC subunit C